MIRFIRLLFYHIYIFYYRKEGKLYAKFTTFGVFIVLLTTLTTTFYNLVSQYYDDKYTTISGVPYIIVYFIIGIIVAYYLNKESFDDFNENIDYNKKYYYYFFVIVFITLCLFIFSSKISRERIFKQREMQRKYIEYKKEKDVKNGN